MYGGEQMSTELLKIIIYILGGIAFLGMLPLFVIPVRKWNLYSEIIEVGIRFSVVFFLLSIFAVFMYAGAMYVNQ